MANKKRWPKCETTTKKKKMKEFKMEKSVEGKSVINRN